MKPLYRNTKKRIYNNDPCMPNKVYIKSFGQPETPMIVVKNNLRIDKSQREQKMCHLQNEKQFNPHCESISLTPSTSKNMERILEHPTNDSILIKSKSDMLPSSSKSELTFRDKYFPRLENLRMSILGIRLSPDKCEDNKKPLESLSSNINSSVINPTNCTTNKTGNSQISSRETLDNTAHGILDLRSSTCDLDADTQHTRNSIENSASNKTGDNQIHSRETLANIAHALLELRSARCDLDADTKHTVRSIENSKVDELYNKFDDEYDDEIYNEYNDEFDDEYDDEIYNEYDEKYDDEKYDDEVYNESDEKYDDELYDNSQIRSRETLKNTAHALLDLRSSTCDLDADTQHTERILGIPDNIEPVKFHDNSLKRSKNTTKE